jgi:hypothetical protein
MAERPPLCWHAAVGGFSSCSHRRPLRFPTRGTGTNDVREGVEFVVETGAF